MKRYDAHNNVAYVMTKLFRFYARNEITSFVDHLCDLCLVFVMLSSQTLFIAVLAGKGLTSWLLFVMFNCTFVTLPCGILGQVLY